MPREVRAELTTLINSGRCNWDSTMDIVLTGGVELFLSTAEIEVDRFGKEEEYQARLSAVEALEMSVDPEVDGQAFKISNVDLVVGQLLTGAVRRLDGAQAVSGVLFIDPDDPVPTNAIWDAKMPGELLASEVNDSDVSFAFVSSIDSVIVPGRTIASEFQWREQVSNVPLFDPNDMPTGPLPVAPIGGGGRYSDPQPYDFPIPLDTKN